MESQGCQLPDLSLRFQTICYFADFSTTFLYVLTNNQDFFAHSITKPPASTLELKNFDFILQKFLLPQTKTRKAPPPSWLLLQTFLNTMLATLIVKS